MISSLCNNLLMILNLYNLLFQDLGIQKFLDKYPLTCMKQCLVPCKISKFFQFKDNNYCQKIFRKNRSLRANLYNFQYFHQYNTFFQVEQKDQGKSKIHPYKFNRIFLNNNNYQAFYLSFLYFRKYSFYIINL